jgi:TonB family protein
VRILCLAFAAWAVAATPAWCTSRVSCAVADPTGLPPPWTASRQSVPSADVAWRVEGNAVFRRDAQGEKRFEPDDDVDLLGIFFVTTDEGWIVGQGGAIFHTRNGGSSWRRQDSGVDDDLVSITCSDPRHCWVVQAAGALLRTSDGGGQWSRSALIRASGPRRFGPDPTPLVFLDSQVGWIASPDGTLQATTDGGASWIPQTVRFDDEIVTRLDTLWFSDAQQGWAASGNRLARTLDGGRSWELTLTIDEALSFWAIASHDGRRVFAATGGDCHAHKRTGVNYVSEDGGATWEEHTGPLERSVDWEEEIRDPRSASLERLWIAGRNDYRVLDVSATAGGVLERSLLVRRRASECHEVEILTGNETKAASLVEWAGGLDPCRLDPQRVESALQKLAPAAVEAVRIIAQCDGVRKVFDVPDAARPPLRRASPSLLRLVDLAHRTPEEPGSTAEPKTVAALRAGQYDEAFESPGGLQALLTQYRGPERRGTRAVVEWLEPPHLRPAGVLPDYPAIAKVARVAGKVTLDLTLDDNGAVREARASSHVPLLDAAGVEAARSWRFQAPAVASDMSLRVVLDFKLELCAILD